MGKIQIGQVLSDRYRVDGFIASGGMGAVYRVWDLDRNVPLAIKTLHADLADDPSLLKHFQREGRALQKLAHPRIVPFYGFFQADDNYFLLEAYIDGPSLKEILQKFKGSPLSIQETLIYLKALCSALGYAHSHGVVHCDVKPGNVMIDKGGNIYLTDFGVLRYAESTATTFATAGTADYMAPEQIRGEPVTPATDVYSLGIVLFEMLTGKRPFRGEGDIDNTRSTRAERIRQAHLSMPPPDPCSTNIQIPRDLGGVILKALEKDPKYRYLNTQDFFNAICLVLGTDSAEIPDRIQIIEDQISNFGTQAEIRGDGKKAPKRKTGLWLILFAAICILLLLAYVFMDNKAFVKNERQSKGSLSSTEEDKNQTMAITITVNLTSVAELTAIQGIQETEISLQRSQVKATQAALDQISTDIARTIINVTLTADALSQVPSNTPLVINSPTPSKPSLRLNESAFCREGPGVSYTARYTVYEGQSYPVLARWTNGWLLLGINDPAKTRTRCCWVVGDSGSLNMNPSQIPSINYLPDRIICDLNP